MQKQKALSYHSITAVSSIFGDKRKLLLLCELFEGPRRFTQLQHALRIAPKALACTLRSLENDRLICRESFSEFPPKVVYSLTPLGETLRPLFSAISSWSALYFLPSL